ncbi:GNAT family N-acetyltransferase [Chryseolinea sp. T2]|uniref:GNAT family N-acetyltransferase n=1 Tax=Chryseolinea sp. T2 TaxID=3129255 RepID=UPI0030775B5B
MNIERCTYDDYVEIISNISEFWGSDRTLNLHHPMYVYEFGDTAFVIRENNRVMAYMFGFYAQTRPMAYAHLVGVRADAQRRGLGSMLYHHFMSLARERGCKTIKAMTGPTNAQSIAFHKKIGMRLLGEINEDGVTVVRNYSGPGVDRVVFEQDLF